MRKLSENGIRMLIEFEGMKLQAYTCPAGIVTIGAGSTRMNGKPIALGTRITLEQAMTLLRNDLLVFEAAVRREVTRPLTQNQFDALVLFTYNVGVGALRRSTLLRKVVANPSDPTIREEFMKWTRANGRVLNGLVRRRTAEADLYFRV